MTVSDDDAGSARGVPDDPQRDPEQALDSLEERVFGDTVNQTREKPADETPAFEQDLEPEDQGSAEAGGEQSG